MKLRSYLIPLLAVSFLFSCSKEDDFGKVTPEEAPQGMLSLIVDANVKTRAEETVKPQDQITRLTVLVFQDNAAGTLVAMADSTLSEANIKAGKSITYIQPFAVSAGSVRVLAIANAYKTESFTGKTLSQVRSLQADLTNEIHGHLTMNSKILKASIKPNVLNLIGTASDGTNWSIDANPLLLYRNVARIELASIALQKTTSYGEAVSFQLDSVFVANVKSQSLLVPTEDIAGETNWGLTEVENSSFWHGAFKKDNDHYEGPLRLKEGDEKDFLVYDFAKGEENVINYYDEARDKYDGAIKLEAGETFTNDKTVDNVAVNYPIGNFFYAYENMKENAGAQTVLVVSGKYTYTVNGTKIEMPNRYYAVVVNKGVNNTDGVAAHEFVKRNTKYRIAMTLTGPGSDKPYDPSVAAHVSAKIDVLDWKVVKVIGTVD